MSDYDTGHPLRLTALQHIRLRPRMYIGSTDPRVLNTFIFEVIVEAIYCGCTDIQVILQKADTVKIYTQGNWLKVEPIEKADITDLEDRLTPIPELYKKQGGYRVDGALHVGLSVVNALSHTMHVEARQAGFLWQQSFKEGQRTSDLIQVRPLSADETESIVFTFTPDFTILERGTFDFIALAQRLREFAFLINRLTLSLRDERDEGAIRELTFHEPDGLLAFLRHVNRDAVPLHSPIHVKTTFIVQKQNVEDCPITIEFAIQYTEGDAVFELSFANGGETLEGGTHLRELKVSLYRFLSTYALERGYIFERMEDIFAGLTAIIGIEYAKVAYIGTARREILNSEIEEGIFHVIWDTIQAFADKNPDQLQRLIDHFWKHRHHREIRRFGDFATSAQD